MKKADSTRKKRPQPVRVPPARNGEHSVAHEGICPTAGDTSAADVADELIVLEESGRAHEVRLHADRAAAEQRDGAAKMPVFSFDSVFVVDQRGRTAERIADKRCELPFAGGSRRCEQREQTGKEQGPGN
jgi:hypothetical protein